MSNTKCKGKIIIDREQKDLDRLRHISDQIRPEVLSAAVRLLAGTDVSAVAQLIRGRVAAPPVRSGYFYMVEHVRGAPEARLYRNDDLLASGSTVEVFSYAAEEHPGALRIIMAELQGGGLYVPLPKGATIDIADKLLAYRKCRAKCAGLDALTKLAQLKGIEQDHVCLKFRNASHLDGCNIAMVGSGALGGTHTVFMEPVVQIDPLIPYSGQSYDKHVKEKWQDVDFTGFDAIISDVAAGTAVGMSQNTTFKPPRNFEGAVYVKLDLQNNSGPPGRVVRKPRPHNTEVIWEVDWGGKSWEEQLPALRQAIVDSNEARMRRFFDMEGTTTIMGYSYPVERVDHVRDREYSIPPITRGRRLVVGATPSNVTLGLKKREERLDKFSDQLLRFTEADLAEQLANPSTWCLLRRDHLIPGGASRLDPCIGTAEFAVRSVLLSAVYHGFRPVRTPAGWHVLQCN